MPFALLVKPARLARHLDDPSWVVFDCRFDLADPRAGRRAYRRGHIPGARYAHLDDDLSGPRRPGSGRHPLPEPRVLARKLGICGVGRGRQVVVYDAGTGAFAARLWWLLRWLGHREVAVLDGGLQRWRREGYALTHRQPHPRRRRFRVRLQPDMAVPTAAVVRSLGTGGFALVDAREPDRFAGRREPIDPVAGHVPGAVNHPFALNVDGRGAFLPRSRLRLRLQSLLASRPAPGVVHMCGSGVTACHNVLAMELAGLPGSRLYPGSWSEWITDPKRPVAKGAG